MMTLAETLKQAIREHLECGCDRPLRCDILEALRHHLAHVRP